MSESTHAQEPEKTGTESHGMASEKQELLDEALKRYWRRNILILAALLFIWAFVGLGCGILWADWLNNFRLFGTGYPLGFWFAQQGSIITFVLIILSYCLLMNKNDQMHHEDLEAIGSMERRRP